MTTIDRPSRALMWAEQTFGSIALDPHERVMRFLEEAIELGHAIGISGSDVQNLVGRIWARKRGEVARELGQAQLTLELLSKAIGISADEEALKEFYRIQSIPKEEWERRHAAKVKLGIAS
jgi:hypothetical protein